MNTYTLDTLSLQYIRRPVDDAARTELSEFFCTAYNEIYRRLLSDPYKLSTAQVVNLTPEHTFSTQSLNNTLIRIRRITSGNGSKLMWERSDGNTVTVHTSDKIAVVSYYYMPQLLTNPTPTQIPLQNTDANTPVIPQEYHNIFSLWAAYRYMHSRRKQEDANYYYEMAMELFYQIKSDIGQSTNINVDYIN